MADPTRPDDVKCLTEDIVRKFLTGELDDEQDQVVSDHLEECGACQRLTMTFLSVDDLCLPWVKASGRETVDLAKRSVDTVMINRLKQIASAEGNRRHESGTEPVYQPADIQVPALPGRIDKYEIVAEIGRGGMGTVYLGIDHDQERECAIKVLAEARGRNQKAIERSYREIHAIGRLKHPNIVAVSNAGTLDDGRTFLAMEFLRGSDLQSLVQTHGPLAADEACRIIIEAARGLQHAHEHGFVHRDVKPSNLFQTEEGDVKLLDFGLVQLKSSSIQNLDTLTESGLVLGTVDFLSPEQALNSRSADLRSDVYSLGCTLAWLVSARQVYPGKSVTKVLFAHRDQPIPELESLQPTVPAGLNAIFQKMVAKRPEDRFQSMAEVIDALARFRLMKHDKTMAELPPSTETPLRRTPQPPTSTPQLPLQPRQKRRFFGWLIAFVSLTIVVVTVIIRPSGQEPAQASIEQPIAEDPTSIR
ncbi:protein kinase [bacterium]|nr:protein kinase [bacterium]